MIDFKYYALSALAVIISLTVHEFSHAFAAYKLGDPTARNFGRLTLNPIKHIDIFGALCMLFFHFGWAKPVPVNDRYFKHPRRDFALTSVAGPISNIILAIVFGFLYLLLKNSAAGVLSYGSEFVINLFGNVLTFVGLMHIINVGLAVFNLIPIPPLDGSRLIGLLLPERIYDKMLEYERYIYFVLLGWLFLGDRLVWFLRELPLIAENAFLYTAVGIFSLSEIVGYAMNFVSNGILELLALLPFL